MEEDDSVGEENIYSAGWVDNISYFWAPFMLTYRQHFRINFQLAWPVVLSQLGHVLVGVSDSVMVGWTGTVPLAGASLGNVLFHIFLTFGLGVSYGQTPLIAAADGRGNTSDQIKYLNHSLLINMVTAFALCLPVLFGGGLLENMGQPEEVVIEAKPYLLSVTLSLIPLMFFQTFRQFMEGLSLTRPPMYISILSNILNIGLNYVFIFGKLGVPAMGLVGAGWASFLSRVVMAVAIAVYFFTSPRFGEVRKGLGLKGLTYKTTMRILNIGLPAAFQYLFEVGAFGLAVVMIGWLGAKSLAAHQIAINLASVTYMMATGLAAAMTIRVGNQLGRKDFDTLERAANSLFIMVVGMMAVAAGVFFAGRGFFPSLYVSDVEVVYMASGLIILAGVFQISDGVQVVALGGLRALEDTRVPTAYVLFAYGACGLPVGYVLSFVFDYGVYGVWAGLLTGLTLVSVGLFLRFRKVLKKRRIASL